FLRNSSSYQKIKRRRKFTLSKFAFNSGIFKSLTKLQWNVFKKKLNIFYLQSSGIFTKILPICRKNRMVKSRTSQCIFCLLPTSDRFSHTSDSKIFTKQPQ